MFDEFDGMESQKERKLPGQVRDAIIQELQSAHAPLSVSEISDAVKQRLGDVSTSSVRSYLRLNTPELFVRIARGHYYLASAPPVPFESDGACGSSAQKFPCRKIGLASAMFQADCFDWLKCQASDSIHAVVTDPPYGLFEYTEGQVAKLRDGKGGVWRIPPAFDGHRRSPLPRFTVLSPGQLQDLRAFFARWGAALLPKLVPGANVVVASNPLLSYIVADALAGAGLERRGEIIRLTMTMRGGDRPKAAHEEFSEVSVMPRSMWEPWLVYRKPLDGRVQDNLRKWGTGGFRRPEKDKPFGDVIVSAPTRKSERALAPHPSLKPQTFLRQLVRAVLPLGRGVVVDTFAGSGSTLAAAEAVGYESIGVEKDETYFKLACEAVTKLAKYDTEKKSKPSESTCEPVYPAFPEFGDFIPM
ncbi:MAG: site-specific DNA-methyltransferase [Acidobacteriota bacterium]|jgi:site-specific DNA-methyltransferase (adenine-specific)|nr:site-specific DNA-methyltransferase [Acidobacteriota bacterium]